MRSLNINFLRETTIRRTIELNQIKRQIEVLSTFVPDHILNNATVKTNNDTFVGVLLLIDVSGFTLLCEKYNKIGKGGIYRLTATLNAYIGAIIEIIYFYGGDVIKFSGDALLAMWKAPNNICLHEVIHEVIVCALFIHQNLGCFKTEVNIVLQTKLAISSGSLTFSLIGNHTHRHFIIAGETVNDVKNARNHSDSGDVVITLSAWGYLDPKSYKTINTESGNVQVKGCRYQSNKKEVAEAYERKAAAATTLCKKHINHRNHVTHQKSKIRDNTTDDKFILRFVNSLPERPPTRSAPQNWDLNELNTFIIKPVQTQVEEKQPIEYLTEMREVTIQLINIKPTTYNKFKLIPMINSAYQIVCGLIDKQKGVVNKITLFEKDVKMSVVFGLRGIKHQLDSQYALKSAHIILEAIRNLSTVESVSVGIANGLVYCGVVGHPLRREYVVIGGAVKKATQIIYEHKNKVTCDHETYKSCKLSSSCFQLQSAQKPTGTENIGHIFEYNENFDKICHEKLEFIPLVGRDLEMEFIHYLMTDTSKVSDYHGVCFRGETNIGKSKILRSTYNKYRNNCFVGYVTLQKGMHRPYFCASLLYRQLYDIAAEKNSPIIRNIPKDLWNFNDILQKNSAVLEQSSKDEDVILNNFTTLCGSGTKKFAITIVDNIQFLDNRSFEVLEYALKNKVIRLVSAGLFSTETSWIIMWKLSLSNQIKLIDIEPLPVPFIGEIMCKFLDVKGVSTKLVMLISKICEGKPSWIQTCLLKLINSGEIEVKYVASTDNSFTYLKNVEDVIVLVAEYTQKYSKHSKEFTLEAISVEIIDSFTPFEQLIIKVSAVLGETLSRNILIVLLRYPNKTDFADAIKNLFEENVFGCASRTMNSGELETPSNSCQCYVEEKEKFCVEEYSNFPKYAFCTLLYFKSSALRFIAYDLLPVSQKKELHLKITNLLENQNNACPNCQRDNSSSIINMASYSDVMKCAEVNLDGAELFQNVVWDGVKKPAIEESAKVCATNRKIWDPTTCSCLEILTKVYTDLVHHSHCAEHLGKKVFFMLQYSIILVTINEYEDAIPILNQASEFCMISGTPTFCFTQTMRKLLMGKIHILLALIYFRMRNLRAAKNHVILSLRQHNIPMVSFNYTIPHAILNRVFYIWLGRFINDDNQVDNAMLKRDFGICLGVASRIFAVEGYWDLAKSLSTRSLSCMTRTNSNLVVICDLYSNAIDLYNFCGDKHLCQKLEKCLNKNLTGYYAKNVTTELYAVTKLIGVIFQIKVMHGNIPLSIRQGYKALELNMTLQAYHFQTLVAPILATILIMAQRIDEAVYLARLLYNIGEKFNEQGFVGYYSFCIELIVEANFYLEPIQQIEKFANEYFTQTHRDMSFTNIDNKLLIYLYNYSLRHCSDAFIWRNLYDWDCTQNYTILGISNLFKCTECVLLELVRRSCAKTKFTHSELERALRYLRQCKSVAKKWNFFMPRYLHYKAYFYRINNKRWKARRYLKRAHKISSVQGNVLEQCWTLLHLSYWEGGFSFERGQIKNIPWKFANTYSSLQWCQILYSLPLN